MGQNEPSQSLNWSHAMCVTRGTEGTSKDDVTADVLKPPSFAQGVGSSVPPGEVESVRLDDVVVSSDF